MKAWHVTPEQVHDGGPDPSYALAGVTIDDGPFAGEEV